MYIVFTILHCIIVLPYYTLNVFGMNIYIANTIHECTIHYTHCILVYFVLY